MRIIFILGLICVCNVNCKQAVSSRERINRPVPAIHKISLEGNHINNYAEQLDFFGARSQLISYKSRDWIFLHNPGRNQLQLFGFDDPGAIDSLPVSWNSTEQRILDYRDGLFYAYNLDRNMLEIYRIINNRLQLTDSAKFGSYDPKNIFLRRSMFEPLISDSAKNLVLSFALHNNPKTSYRDINAGFLVLGTEKEPVKMGRFPADYFEKPKYYYSNLFTGDKKEFIYYTFELHDSVYKTDRYGNNIASGKLGDEVFKSFDWRKEMDLAYVRKYSEETERNERIFLLKRNRLLVLKKLPKTGVLTRPVYRYMVLDSNLNTRYADTVRHYCYPWFVSDYKNGFVLLGDSLKSAYYYEMD